jgi:hypothetical protein
LGTNIALLSVKDGSGNNSYSTNIVVVRDQTPPLLLAQPQNRTNLVGTTASFAVGASGCTTLAYQWFYNNTALPGQTNSGLSLGPVDSTNAGNYLVVVTSAGGVSTSAVATLTVNLISTSLALNSSANSSGYKDTVNFTVNIAPANAAGAIEFLTNGVVFDNETLVAGQTSSAGLATLPRGTNVISAIYSGDPGHLPATNTLAQIVTNHPPTAVSAFYTRPSGGALTIVIANLATNWSDSDGDIISLANVSVSTNGVTLTNAAGTLGYINSNNVADQFSCAIADGWGGTNVQMVAVAPTPPVIDTSPVIKSVAPNVDGSFTLNLIGATGSTYVLESITNLEFSNAWIPISTNTPASNGSWQFSDAQATNFSRQFYRLKLLP